jgi:hypothetical protein
LPILSLVHELCQVMYAPTRCHICHQTGGPPESSSSLPPSSLTRTNTHSRHAPLHARTNEGTKERMHPRANHAQATPATHHSSHHTSAGVRMLSRTRPLAELERLHTPTVCAGHLQSDCPQLLTAGLMAESARCAKTDRRSVEAKGRSKYIREGVCTPQLELRSCDCL